MDEMKVIFGFSCGHRGKAYSRPRGLTESVLIWDGDKERKGPKELGVVISSITL